MNGNQVKIAEEIIKRICQCGWNAYLVGGAVRDEFLGISANDLDITTDALPEELEQIFPDKKVKTFGISFLVTTVDGIDVATYRSDKNCGPDRNNCVTTACTTLDEDLARRDFTFNSLAVCPYTGEVIDPYNGRTDLQNKVVRFVGDPEQRIYEDYLRMIRAARFACLIEGILHPSAFKAITLNRKYVTEISPERIRIELLKVMKYKSPSIFFNILYDTGILELLIPEFSAMYGHVGGKYHTESVYDHCLIAGDALSPKDPILRLAGYLHDIGKVPAYDGEHFINHEVVGADIVETILKRFRFTKKEIERTKNLTRFHMRSYSTFATPKSTRKFLRALETNGVIFEDWMRLRIADRQANLMRTLLSLQEIKTMVLKVRNVTEVAPDNSFGVKSLKVNGRDIMVNLNIKPGKQVGNILNYLVDVVIDDPDKNEKDILISLAREYNERICDV